MENCISQLLNTLKVKSKELENLNSDSINDLRKLEMNNYNYKSIDSLINNYSSSISLQHELLELGIKYLSTIDNLD